MALGAIAGISPIGGAILSTIEGKKAQKADNLIRLNQLRRERTKQLRAARIKREEIVNIAAQTGTGGSSAAISAQGQAITEAARNVSFLDTQANLSRQRVRAQQRGRFFQSLSQVGQQLTSFVTGPTGTQLLG